jgi:hypothetical protein
MTFTRKTRLHVSKVLLFCELVKYIVTTWCMAVDKLGTIPPNLELRGVAISPFEKRHKRRITKRNDNPPASEQPRSFTPPRSERPSEA